MIKVIPHFAQDLDDRPLALIPLSERGLVGSDRQRFAKRASAVLLDEMRHLKFGPGDVPAHAVALGATEVTGPNRNGDGFRKQACRDYHHTFVKLAKLFRNHRNRDSDPYYGIIKASAYNEDMGRIELILAYNGTKEAAERNGGLIADQELERLESGKDLATSMACRIGFDCCSSCQNKARNRKEYCKSADEGGSCPHGGLASNIGRVFDDGHHLHADNPHPSFFDFSKVGRGADMISFVVGKLQKAASSGNTISGAEIAEDLALLTPPHVMVDQAPEAIAEYIKAAAELAALEQTMFEDRSRLGDRLLLTGAKLILANHYQRYDSLGVLTKQGALAPLAVFAAMVHPDYAGKRSAAVKEAADALLGDARRLLEDVELESLLTSNPYSGKTAARSPSADWTEKTAAAYAVSGPGLARRYRQAVIQENGVQTPDFSVKNASAEARQLAREYTLYRIAAIADSREQDRSGFLDMAALYGMGITH